jgi:hypothetical protein
MILSVIFNLIFQFNKKFSETAKYHQRLFNHLVIPSVIFNLIFYLIKIFQKPAK